MFVKVIENGFVTVIGTGIVGVEITEPEYNAIMQKIQNKPTNPEGYQYKLRAYDLEWVMVELPEPEPVDETADISDYENALSEMGVQFND